MGNRDERQRMGDVVILLPGILGSVLTRDGRCLGSLARRGGAGAVVARSEHPLAAARGPPARRDELGDGVVASRLVPDVHLILVSGGIDGYSGISRMIHEQFDVVDGQTYLEFPYDWRRGTTVSPLGACARARRQDVASATTTQSRCQADPRRPLHGRARGAVLPRVPRRLARHTAPRHVRHAVCRGSVNAVDFLVNGFEKRLGPLKVVDLTDLLSLSRP